MEEDPKAVPEGSTAHKSTEEDPKMVPEGYPGECPSARLAKRTVSAVW